ncbi:hypothetical protein B0J18DRAFT_442424 [Chaetomium sp. MPI-SDFR-AT-0129]|nr:hypothetical protein B0J18DRAFT_442424 [Chaetomium sp. MPI-SDFR-AT-0129]
MVVPKVATSIPEWANMMRQQLGVKGADPDKNDKIWAADTASWCFSSGSDLDEKDYLLLRVIWTHNEDTNDLSAFVRNNPDLDGAAYTGYVSPENDALAKQIYGRLKPEFEGYLEDIRSNTDGTRPRPNCGKYSTVRYWQAMAVAKIKEFLSQPEVAALPKKVRKRVILMSSSPPAASSPSAAGAGAAADSSDDDDNSAAGKLTTSMAKTTISGPPTTPVRQVPRAQPLEETPMVPKSYPVAGGTQNPALTDEYYVNTAILVLLQQLLSDMRQLATEPPDRRLDFRGLDFWGLDLEDVDWLLMEARVDGYLCKRGYKRHSHGRRVPMFNNLPLAIIEAKPCVRRAAASAIRWQESAEMASWASNLTEESEHYGLLQSSSSGRKRRLLQSQNREEIYITVAEYGEAWKQYIRAGSPSTQPTPRSKGDEMDLAGSDAFVRNSMAARAAQFLPAKKSKGPYQTRAQKELKLLDHDHFCFMHQWGPFLTRSDVDMELLIRRLVALQVQLLSTASAGPI